MPNVVPIPLAMLTRPPTSEADESATPRMITVLFAGTKMPRPTPARASCGTTVAWVTGRRPWLPMTAQVSSAPARPRRRSPQASRQHQVTEERGQPEAERQGGQQQARPRRATRSAGQDLRDQHQRPEQREVAARGAGQAERQRPEPEQPHRDQRVHGTGLPADERDRGRQGEDRQQHGQPGRQAQPGHRGERQQQRARRDHQQHGTRAVEFPGRTELPGPRQQVAARDDRRRRRPGTFTQ